MFPSLINSFHNTIKIDFGISGFRKTGLYPLDKTKMMNEERFAISSIFQTPSSSISSSSSTSSLSTSSSLLQSCNSPNQIIKRRTSLSMDLPKFIL
jgi:hypothetical protein